MDEKIKDYLEHQCFNCDATSVIAFVEKYGEWCRADEQWRVSDFPEFKKAKADRLYAELIGEADGK